MSELAIDELGAQEERRLAEVLSEFTRTMPPDSSIQAILDHLVERIVEILPINAAGVTLLPRSNEHPYVAASDASALEHEQLQQHLAEGPNVLASRSGKAVSAPDLRGDDRFPTFGPSASSTGVGAMFTFPLRHANHRLGALDLYRDSAGPLTHQAMGAAQTVADMVTAHLINARAREDRLDDFEPTRQMSLRDELTGLPNRDLMLDRLDIALRHGRRAGRSAAVICVDLDLPEPVNDTRLHQVRDELLVTVARRLRGLLRRGDTLARLSGDVFGILCEDLDNPDQAVSITARLATALTTPQHPTSAAPNPNASVGVAWAGPGRTAAGSRHSPEQLLRDAYLSRVPSQTGSDQPEGADIGWGDSTDLVGDLMQAQARGEFHVEYQPIVDTVTDRVVGLEALLRWDHPSRGSIPPAVFIPLAEQSGLINQLGCWVLLQACIDRLRWQDQHPGNDLAMAVNVSVHQLMSPGFPASVAAVLAATRAEPRLLILEITESVFIKDSERALVVLAELKDLGVRLALDDFGTGYSSLSYLRRFPVQILKIDRAFIVDVVRDPVSHSIVGAIVDLAHNLGMTVVAEGVETAEQHDEVGRLGCDYYQGYYFARPCLAPGNLAPGDPAPGNPAPGNPAPGNPAPGNPAPPSEAPADARPSVPIPSQRQIPACTGR